MFDIDYDDLKRDLTPKEKQELNDEFNRLKHIQQHGCSLKEAIEIERKYNIIVTNVHR